MAKSIHEIMRSIEEKLNEQLIGQKEFLHRLCGYMEEKITEEKAGVLLIIGEKETSKKTSIRLLFEYLQQDQVLDNGIIDELNLGEYDFNLGYNAFLTDLYTAMNSPSHCILFKNVEQASPELLTLIGQIYPNKSIALGNKYVINNQFFMEANNSDEQTTDELVCANKFFMITANEGTEEVPCFVGATVSGHVDLTLLTNRLSEQDRNIILKKEIEETIKRIENKFNVRVVLVMNSDEQSNRQGDIYQFIEDSYHKDTNFGLYDYVSYKVSKPLKNLISKESIPAKSTIVLYVEQNDVYCKSEQGVFKLTDYSIPTLEEARYKLNSIIGIDELKVFMENVENNYRVQKIRDHLGYKSSTISMNMIFAGNAGTGKTNAARITYEYLNALGILSKGIYKEVSKADFVTEHVNDLAKRTDEIVRSAIGGVLFIDEAYSLCESEEDKVGKEIVDALLKGIEDNRKNLVVILAGYEKDMERFLSINPGLKSRFPNVIHFQDYSPVEMYEIAVNIAKSKGYRIASNVKNELIDLFTRNQMMGKNDLGNARFVRNIIENAIIDASKKYLTNKERQIDLLERDNFNFKARAKFNLEEKLSGIIGLAEVKQLLRNQYKLIVAQEKRKSVGVNTKIDQNLNMVFTGNPGTGKTSVARLVAEMLNSMGLLKVGQMIETDRSSFVSEIPGETAKKTEAKFKEAIGGILFIDEAYTLANDSLGIEAVETLLKLIEDYSKDVIVILAGYEEEMEDFFDVNIGLRSRFPLWTNFADYNPNELLEMAIRLLEAKGFRLSKQGYAALQNSFEDIYEKADAQSGNGRMVRNYVEQLIRNQSIRIAEGDISVYEMNRITKQDIEQLSAIAHENEFNLEERLDRLICNEIAKEFLRNQYKLAKTQERRQRNGMCNTINRNRNIIFTGNIGTGKKTVLNILAEMYYSMGIVKAKSIVEFDANELISQYNSGKKLEDIFSKSLEKIILIDKAHLLMEQPNVQKMLSSLITFLDKNRNRLVMVLNGQREGIKQLIAANDSLHYRFPLQLDFEDYQEQEIVEMGIVTLLKRGFVLEEGAKEELSEALTALYRDNHLALRNGLMVRYYLDQLIRAQSVRVYDEHVEPGRLNGITVADVLLGKEEFIRKNNFCLTEQQEKESSATISNASSIPVQANLTSNVADELIKLKQLLDSQAIDGQEYQLLKQRIIKG